MSTRQSSRLKTKGKAPVKYEEDSDHDYDVTMDEPSSSNGTPQKAPNKRKRKAASPAVAGPSSLKREEGASTSATTLVGVKNEDERPAKRVRGKRGILQQLAEMPLELLFEIFGKLDPIDLLNLSRTTKALRSILMRRSSADIWREALTNIDDLPPCPPDLNEAQWANLLFGKNCYFCGRNTPAVNQTYAWQARVRGCFKCVLAEFSISQQHTLARSIFELIPSFTVRYGQGRRSDRGVHYHGATYHEFVETEKRLTNLEERKKWVDEQTLIKEELVKHAAECEKWLGKRQEARAEELEEMRSQRKLILRRKIEELGFSSTLVDLAFQNREFWAATCITSVLKKDITDRVWAGAEEQVKDVMQAFRLKHAREEHNHHLQKRIKVFQKAYDAFVETQQREVTVIPIADLFLVPEIKEFLLSEPIADPMDKESLDQLLENIPEYTEEWLKNSKQVLVDLMKTDAAALGLDPESVDESSLDLAIAVFKCTSCNISDYFVSASRALVHACATNDRYRYRRTEAYTDLDLRLFVTVTDKTPWNFEGSSFQFRGTTALKGVKLLQKLDMDPATTTAATMDELDPIFEKTNSTIVGRAMATWRGVMRDEHADPDSYVQCDEETTVAVREKFDESMRRDRTSSSWEKALWCAHCNEFKGRIQALRVHLNGKHQIVNPKAEDVWIHPDHPETRLTLEYYSGPGMTFAFVT
ncbi:hypothetical protein DFP72DRAFT_868880 [Ephemerocybe angulata]|uniref:F-box domain-containing protein n=1 Tax=Ephemerocybe angulata TaxID=980116 RepID=A0A8H6IFH7_9AGAR|nr:hypothetical protein DFP72DRAFT_868880 [Tulosesus angulatus]